MLLAVGAPCGLGWAGLLDRLYHCRFVVVSALK
jgi:hypothetical protein